MEREILGYLELSSSVTLACTFSHITTDEAGLHQAEIARDIAHIKWDAFEAMKEALQSVVDHSRENDKEYYRSDLCTDVIAALRKARGE